MRYSNSYSNYLGCGHLLTAGGGGVERVPAGTTEAVTQCLQYLYFESFKPKPAKHL